MTKQITIYEPNAQGVIIKKIGASYEDAEVIDAEPVDEGGGFGNFWAFFFASGATVGGNEWEARHKRETYNDNGREYNGVTGNWEYTPAANGNANPFASNYEAPQDFQGSVPVWDGYNGET